MATFVVLFLLFYLWHGLGITVGYHRLLAHRALRCKPAFEYLLVAGGYLTFQGPPIWWAAIHRAHHRYSDTPLDPHTPLKGMRFALLGWLFENQTYLSKMHLARSCKDLLCNDFYRMLEPKSRFLNGMTLCLLMNIVYRALLFSLFGATVFWANLASSICVFMIPQLLNVTCHLQKMGYKNFATNDDGVNVWWVGILGLGEGWHNNHHAYPGSARTGLLPHEVDVSWHVIRLARFFGLVTYANEPKRMLRLLRPRKPKAVARLRRIRHYAAIRKTA